MCPNTIYSHFINVIINKDDKVIKLSDDKFHELNHTIRSSLSNINNNKLSFVDNKPFEKSMMKIEKRMHILKSKQI